jgi:hypothetical protein
VKRRKPRKRGRQRPEDGKLLSDDEVQAIDQFRREYDERTVLTPEQAAKVAEFLRKVFVDGLPPRSFEYGPPGPSWGEPLEDDVPPGTVRVYSGNLHGSNPAIEEAKEPLEPSAWLSAEIKRRKNAGDIPAKAARFAQQLARQMVKDVRAKKCSKALPANSIRTRLYEKELKKLWSVK